MDTRYVLSKIVFIRKISTFHIYKLFHLSHSTISTKSSPCRKKIFSKFDPSIIINDRSNWKIKRDRWKGVELIGFGSLKGGLERDFRALVEYSVEYVWTQRCLPLCGL